MTPDQNRCAYLGFRCFTGFNRADKEKRNPIPEEKALAEWQEFLEKRFAPPVRGSETPSHTRGSGPGRLYAICGNRSEQS